MTAAKVHRQFPGWMNRLFYGLFIALAVFQLARGAGGEAFASFGLALIFDPFDQEQGWASRPLWQRAWLIGHLVLLCALGGAALALEGY